MGLLDGFRSLSANINKVKSDVPDASEGVVSSLLPELSLDMDDKALVDLKRKWEKDWDEYSKKVQKRQDENERYWMGKQFPGLDYRDTERPIADNMIFEALETFLPIATRQNPEAVVYSKDTDAGQAMADKVAKMLAFLADTLQFKLKIKKVTRFWALYCLGAVKVGWSEISNEIDMRVLRPQKLILDKDATVLESGEYTGEFVGEYREDLASKLVKRFPEKEAYIREKCQDKMGTKMRYIEWWTDEMLFWTLEDEVLGKVKNPHWNYEQKEMQMDAFGVSSEVALPGKNHFTVPKKPYVFLSVFNLGNHPFDDVSIIEQNLSLQDLINKRLRQIDKNADATNGGLIVSGANSGLSKEQAADATEALRRGGTIYIPSGDVNSAIRRETGTPIPSFIYESLMDYRSELRDIFGIRGSTADSLASTDTVRGKLLVKSQDESRLALIAEYIEQFSDRVFNWFVQLMYVYYDEPHFASVLGEEKARQFIEIQSSDIQPFEFVVSVKEGSLIPKDPLTQRNEAVELWTAGALSPVQLFDRLGWPDPQKAAEQLYIWQTNPASLFPNIAPPMAAGMPPGSPQVAPGSTAGAPVTQGTPNPAEAAASVPTMQSDLAQVPIGPTP